MSSRELTLREGRQRFVEAHNQLIKELRRYHITFGYDEPLPLLFVRNAIPKIYSDVPDEELHKLIMLVDSLVQMRMAGHEPPLNEEGRYIGAEGIVRDSSEPESVQ